MYPITTFVTAAMATAGLKRGPLVTAMGYRNTAKALRHLDGLLEYGAAPEDFLARLVTALGVSAEDFAAAMAATDEIQCAAERQARDDEIARRRAEFRPVLRVVSERTTPQPILAAAWSGMKDWMEQAIGEDVMALPDEQRLQVVGEMARAHYAKRRGRVGPFGAIIGFRFWTTFDDAIELDIEGRPTGTVRRALQPLGEARLRVG